MQGSVRERGEASGRVGLSGGSAPGRARKRGEEQASAGESRQARGRVGERRAAQASTWHEAGITRGFRGSKAPCRYQNVLKRESKGVDKRCEAKGSSFHYAVKRALKAS